MKENERAVLMQGNEACVRGALDAGATFYAGYPITPATEIAEMMSEELPKIGGAFLQSEDELACMGAVFGASLAGKKAMTATSGPGFTLIQENLGLAVMAEAPCVVVCVQRTGPSTGIATLTGQGEMMMGRWGTHGDHPMICLTPSTVEECYTMTFEAFNLAERYRTPVIVFTDAVLGHIREKAVLPDKATLKIETRRAPTVPPEQYLPYDGGESGVPAMGVLGDGYRYYRSGTHRDETGTTIAMDTAAASRLVRRLHEKVEGHIDEFAHLEAFLMDDAEYAVVSYGITARTCKQAVLQARAEGIRVGMVKLETIWPFPQKLLRETVKNCKGLLMVEMNLGQIVGEVERAVAGRMPVEFYGVIGGRLVLPEEVYTRVKEMSGK